MSGQRDVEAHNPDDFYTSEFDDKLKRNLFIRKVYAILTLQLLITVILCSIFMFVDEVRYFWFENIWLVYLCMAFAFSIMCVLSCCPTYRRESPLNFVLLTLFTLTFGTMLAAVTSGMEVEAVYIAAIVTCAVCFAVSVFAFQTKWDITMWGGCLYAMLYILIIGGMFMVFFKSPLAHVVYGALGAIVFSFYLMYDTQRLMGDRNNPISSEEYIFAALSLYLDIINIFLFTLQIVTNSN